MSILQTIDLKKYYGTEPNITRALDGTLAPVVRGRERNIMQKLFEQCKKEWLCSCSCGWQSCMSFRKRLQLDKNVKA